jgi:hypothetical protein
MQTVVRGGRSTHFSTVSLLRAASARQTARGLRKPGKKTIDARPRRRKVTTSEPDAEAILPEPRSVKKQIPINLSHGKREKLMSYRINYLPTENKRRFL